MRSLKSDVTTSQDLSSAVLSYTTSYGRKFKLEQILFHASVAISENIIITLDSAEGANYDTVLADVTLVSEQDFIFRPQGQANFQAGDEIKIYSTNANVTGTLYATFKVQEVLL